MTGRLLLALVLVSGISGFPALAGSETETPLTTDVDPDAPDLCAEILRANDVYYIKSMWLICALEAGDKGNSKGKIEWYRRGIKHGNPVAAAMLGSAYERGVGVEKSPSLVQKWYEHAAKGYLADARRGEAGSQMLLGKAYRIGEGVSRDLDKAYYWLKQAAKQGHDTAKLELAVYFWRRQKAEREAAGAK